MPDKRLPKKVFNVELQKGQRYGGNRNATKIQKALLKDFNISTDSWEQTVQDQIKWRCLIKKGAAQYEAKRVCEAERKRKERKARANGSTSELSQYAFTCSICLALFANDSLEQQLIETTIK